MPRKNARKFGEKKTGGMSFFGVAPDVREKFYRLATAVGTCKRAFEVIVRAVSPEAVMDEMRKELTKQEEK